MSSGTHMKIVYTDHLRKRLYERKISLKIVDEIFRNKRAEYYDNLRYHHIIIGKTIYKGKFRTMLAAYDKIGKILEVITTHPITDNQIQQRIESGRWTYEKN